MRILPISRYDYDIYPLTEELIEINDDGSEASSQVEKIGVIDVAEDDLDEIRISKKFTATLDGIESMTAEEIAEQAGLREVDDAVIEGRVLQEKLTALDHHTHLWAEGKLSQEEWTTVVAERDALRQRIAEIL